MAIEEDKKVCVSHIGDLNYSGDDDILLVEGDKDYVHVCKELSRQAYYGATLKVWVRSQSHFVWLRDFTEQIGCPSSFEEKTARLVLTDQWNVTIPDWLTDADVLGQNLLGLKVGSLHQTSFSNRLLIHLLENVFLSDSLSSANLVEVISALVTDIAKEASRRYPVVSRCIEEKCREWIKKGGEDWVKGVCDRLPINVVEVWQWLSLWALLHGYPDKLLEFVLPPQQIAFVKKIPREALDDLPLETTAREQGLTQIRLFFKEIRPEVTSSEAFQKVVGCASGRLFQEYQFVSALLTDKSFPATDEDVKRVQSTFRSCPGVSSSQLSSLAYCVRPRLPGLLNQDVEWNPQEWLRWAVEQYMPYRSWQIHNGYYDEELEQTVKRFSEWYIKEYIAIHRNPDLSLVYALKDQALGDPKEGLSIILLVDCLALNFMDLLDGALHEAGFSRHYIRYYFAPLPTTTEYSKAKLLGGGWQDRDKDYEKILKGRTASDWGDKRVLYLSNLRAFAEMETPAEPAIALLNLLSCDELLHSDVEARNISYEEELHRLFIRIANALSRLSDAWTGEREGFNVYVVTDHGACRILEEEKNAFEAKVVNKLFPDERYRFSVVNEDKADDIPENLWALGQRFTNPFCPDNRVFFLPNGHSTVRIPGRAKGYMHGGVTPEEVIVPTALYKLVKAEWKAPATRFINLNLDKATGRARFYIQRVVTLEIEIQNPNPSDMRILRASVLSPETDIRGCETLVIQPGAVNTLRMDCYFKKAPLEGRCMDIEIVYEVAGETHNITIELESEFKTAMSTGISLRDIT